MISLFLCLLLGGFDEITRNTLIGLSQEKNAKHDSTSKS